MMQKIKGTIYRDCKIFTELPISFKLKIMKNSNPASIRSKDTISIANTELRITGMISTGWKVRSL